MKTLITGGTLVCATGRTTADVLVDGETIAAVVARARRCSAATCASTSTR